MKRLKVRGVGINERKVLFNQKSILGESLYSLRRLGVYYSEKDLRIMLLILGNRHLCNLIKLNLPRTPKMEKYLAKQLSPTK